MPRNLKPIPRNQSEITQDSLPQPYLNQDRAISETVFSKNSGTDYSMKNDTVKDISIGLESASVDFTESSINSGFAGRGGYISSFP